MPNCFDEKSAWKIIDRSVVVSFKKICGRVPKCQCCKCGQAKVETTATNAWSDGNWSLSWSTRTCRSTSAVHIHVSILERQFLSMLTHSCICILQGRNLDPDVGKTISSTYRPSPQEAPGGTHIFVCCTKQWRKFHFGQMPSHLVANLQENHGSNIIRSMKFHQPHFSQHLVEHLSGPVTSQLQIVWPVLSRITVPTWIGKLYRSHSRWTIIEDDVMMWLEVTWK